METVVYKINEIVSILTMLISNLGIVYICIKIIIPILNRTKNLTWDQIKERLVMEVGEDNIFKMNKKDIYNKVKKYIKSGRRSLNLCKIVLAIMFVVSFCILRSTSNIELENYLCNYMISGGIFEGIVRGSVFSMLIYAGFLFLIIVSDFSDNKSTIFIKKNIKSNIFDVYIKDDYINL